MGGGLVVGGLGGWEGKRNQVPGPRCWVGAGLLPWFESWRVCDGLELVGCGVHAFWEGSQSQHGELVTAWWWVKGGVILDRLSVIC